MLAHVTGIAHQMREAFMLRHPLQLFGIVAFTPIANHHAAEFGRYQFPNFFVSMPGPDLVHRQPGIHKCHQKRCFPSHSPPRVIGMRHRPFAYRGA
jgi:hypothetical protein